MHPCTHAGAAWPTPLLRAAGTTREGRPGSECSAPWIPFPHSSGGHRLFGLLRGEGMDGKIGKAKPALNAAHFGSHSPTLQVSVSRCCVLGDWGAREGWDSSECGAPWSLSYYKQASRCWMEEGEGEDKAGCCSQSVVLERFRAGHELAWFESISLAIGWAHSWTCSEPSDHFRSVYTHSEVSCAVYRAQSLVAQWPNHGLVTSCCTSPSCLYGLAALSAQLGGSHTVPSAHQFQMQLLHPPSLQGLAALSAQLGGSHTVPSAQGSTPSPGGEGPHGGADASGWSQVQVRDGEGGGRNEGK